MATELETDCLVIGSGIAGLSAAIAAAEKGLQVIVITAAPSLEVTNSAWAQGGIIYRSENDTPEKLASDILEAGGALNYKPAVKQLSELGPKLVKEILLDRLGVEFDQKKNGQYFLTREAAHSENRILHQGDQSGRAIETKFVEYCSRYSQIRFLTQTTAVNLLMSSFHRKDRENLQEPSWCFGAFVFDQRRSVVYPIKAKHTVLATGGVGQLYLHHTNNRYARGDGLALAHRAGCRMMNLEYMQFHPTTFYRPPARRFLISEALRGEGAVLINAQGNPFLEKYLPNYSVPELAPRDKLAKAIHEEMLSQGAECVYLNISHKPADWIEERFPFVYHSCLEHQIDIRHEPIPVVPGAHYHIGGIWVDLCGRTSVANLWAVGEASCTGLHGVNRLASTSLLEGLVWGTRAGNEIGLEIESSRPYPDIYPWNYQAVEVDPSFLKQDWLTLKHTMWNYVGLIKTDSRLERAAGILSELSRGIDVFYRKARLSDELIGLRHAALASLLILDACKRNRKSQGCYLREEIEI